MKARELIKLVGQSLRRNKRDFVLSSIGIIIGIGTLIFFTALGAGVKDTVLERIFVIRQLEVVKPSYDMGSFQLGGLFGEKKLDDAMVSTLGEIDGVSAVYPKMKLTFPSSIKGGEALLGRDMWAELISDGIPPSLVQEETSDGELTFQDWEAVACTSDDACPASHSCVEGVCKGDSCQDDTACEGLSYCHETEKICLMPIPVLANPSVLEIYNGSLQTAMGGAAGAMGKLPKLSQKALLGFQGSALFGKSYLGRSKGGKRVERRVRLVGFSDKAIQLGLTMPIGYVKRLNRQISGESAAAEYHSIVVDATSNDVVASVAQTITEGMGLALSSKYQNAQRAGLLILLITLVFNLVSLIFLAIAAINIMHTFLMIILERRRELALMRAVGATAVDIRALVLAEATALGLFGGALGIVVGFGASKFADHLLATQVGDFPYKPESLFVFEPWMFAASIVVAVVFCWIGSSLPAIRASRIDPASALAGR